MEKYYICFECGLDWYLSLPPTECGGCDEWDTLMVYVPETDSYRYVYNRTGEPNE